MIVRINLKPVRFQGRSSRKLILFFLQVCQDMVQPARQEDQAKADEDGQGEKCRNSFLRAPNFDPHHFWLHLTFSVPGMSSQ
jgi:hypothetical protein